MNVTEAQKQKDKETLAKIRDLIQRAPIDWEKYHSDRKSAKPGTAIMEEPEMKRTQAVMEEAEALDRSQAPDLKVGRLVSWAQGDGSAMYFVTRIGKRMVDLEHFPWGDAWQSPVVVNGQALRPAVDQAIMGIDGMRRIFGAPRP